MSATYIEGDQKIRWMGRGQEVWQHGQMCDAAKGAECQRQHLGGGYADVLCIITSTSLCVCKSAQCNFEDIKRNDLILFSWLVQGKYVRSRITKAILLPILFYFETSRLREVGKTAGASQVALVVKSPPANAGDLRDTGSVPGSGISPGGGHGSPVQYSCLENPMDREACRGTVHGVAKSQARLKRLSMYTCATVRRGLPRGLTHSRGKLGHHLSCWIKPYLKSICFLHSPLHEPIYLLYWLLLLTIKIFLINKSDWTLLGI